ncbi:MAG TPA: multicopper oxidase family protein [Bryobacteraceae bacterium]|nr:multicopper oxidase family protein [Acidobacteriaceae bacterium]
MKNVSRRNFMALAAGAAAGAAAPKGNAQQHPAEHHMSKPMEEAAPLPLQANEEHFVPEITLEAKWKIMTIDGHKVKVRAYNDTIPGPLIKTKAGKTLNIRVKNLLTPYDSKDWGGDMNVPHLLDHTNLHLHGLDVAPHIFEPLGTCDVTAAMISIAPGEYKDYPFVIPPDQSPGLNWYHPHAHGSTAVQAVSGMAGGLVILGAIDEVPEIKAAKDHYLVLQDIGLFKTDEPHADYSESYEPKQNAIWQTFAKNSSESVTIDGQPTKPPQSCGFTTGDYHLRYYMVNGNPYFREEHSFETPTSPKAKQLTPPVFKMRPGEVARFRMLNGCSDLMMPIQVEGHTMYLLAMDGNNFDHPWPKEYVNNASQVVLAPANRAEFLIKASEKPGKYQILQLAQNAQFLEAPQKTIAVIEVEGEPTDMKIPHDLPPITRDAPIRPDEIVRKRKFIFSGRFPGEKNPVVGIDFMINNQLYDEFAVPTTVYLNTCEEWTIEVPDSARGGTEGHPFHIHVNDFEIVSVAGIEPPHRLIQDTIWVAQDTATVIRMRFKEWTGKSVFHCHILPHEDTGMMQNFLILPEHPKHHHQRTIESLGEKNG